MDAAIEVWLEIFYFFVAVFVSTKLINDKKCCGFLVDEVVIVLLEFLNFLLILISVYEIF